MSLAYPNPELASSKVSLRAWAYDDLPCVAEASTDPEIPKGTTVPAEFTEEAGAAWIERQWSRQTTGQGLSLAIVERATTKSVGLVYLGLRTPDGHCEIGYWLVPNARGRGLGTEAVMLSSRWVLASTDVYRLFAHVVPGNTASNALLRKTGFSEEGRLRSYLAYDERRLDVISFSLLEEDL